VPYFGGLYDRVGKEQSVEDPRRETENYRKDARERVGPYSREAKKLQGVPSIHGVQCHSQLEDTGDTILNRVTLRRFGRTVPTQR